MGNFLSGWHGRRSARPYFDALPRIAIGDIPAEDLGALRGYSGRVPLFAWCACLKASGRLRG